MTIGLRRVAWLTLASGVGRIPGFLIPVLVAALFGAGPLTDAYFLAYNAVLLVGGTLAQSVEVAIVPFAARELLRSGAAARRFLGATALRLTGASAVAWLIVVPVLVTAAGAALRSRVAVFAACFAPLALLWSAASVHAGALVAERDIAAASGSLLWRGAGGLVGLALAPAGGGLWSVGLGLGAGELGRTLWLRRRVLAKVREPVAVDTAPAVSFAHAVSGMVLGAVTLSLVPVVEKLLAVRLGPGSVSHLEYATRLLIIPAVLFDGALAPHLLAGWSQRVVAEGRAPSRQEIWVAVGRGLLLAAGLAVLVAAFAPQIVGVLLLHGRFQTGDAAAVSSLLRVLAIGFVGSMGALLAERAYLAAARNWMLAALMVLRGGLRVAVVVVLLSSLRLLAFGVGFATAEWCYFLALLVACRPAPVGSLAPGGVEA